MPPERRTGPSYIHAGWCRGMSEEAARVFGVCPPHGRRRRRHLEGGNGRVVYTEGILLWVWPGSCSKVFLWADLPQPGG